MKVKLDLKKKLDERTITIKGKPECVNRILTLLAMIQINGDNGHSGTFGMSCKGISWDGDGSDQVTIDGIKDIIANNKELIGKCSDRGGFAEVVGENNRFYTLNGDANFNAVE